jgi:HD-like signal output (HDOD) protein
MALVAEGFPVPQGRLFELLSLLGDPVLHLEGVRQILRREPRLEAQILRLLSSSPLQEHRRPLGVPEAVVLLGSERLRILVLGCALAEFAGRRLPAETVRDFWQHSLLAAVLSQRIAAEVQPELVEQAYFGGLLHDIGRLPLLIVAQEEAQAGRALPAAVHDHPAREREYFGVDHCEVGRWIACCGNFAPWIAQILEHHHQPARACEEATLTAIVAAGDRGCQAQVPPAPGGAEIPARPPLPAAVCEAPGDGDLFGTRPARLLAHDQALRSGFLHRSGPGTPFPRFSCS